MRASVLVCCTFTSHPPAARVASCLAEGGDGVDGWTDERKEDGQALERTKKVGTVLGYTVRRQQ